jgi:sortase A
MKIVVARESLRRLLWWTQRALFACALLLAGYCLFVLVDSSMFQNRERRSLEQLLPVRQASPPVADDLVGRIEIPRLGVSVIVMEGTGSDILRRAAGHISGTALPGQPGNIGISAHRDTFFRPIRNIRKNDVITLTTPRGEYRYRVVSTRIVSPQDIAVLDPSGGEILTLVTCYPFYFIGPAPSRFIVRAERIA